MISASEFARLLSGRRVGTGKWVCKCPAHREKTASLYVTDGKNGLAWPHCFCGCSQKDILAAMGLSWKDVLGERDVTPEMRGRWADEKRLADLEHNRAIYALLGERDKKIRMQIGEMRRKLYPEDTRLRVRRAMVHRAIAKHGWDKVIAKWEQTDRGRLALERYAIPHDAVTDGYAAQSDSIDAST